MEKAVTIKDVKLLDLNTFLDKRGRLTVVNNDIIPVDIMRTYFVSNVPVGEKRGNHAHKTTQQVLICIGGKCSIVIKDGKEKKEFKLNKCYEALYVPAMLWDEITYKEENTVLLVFADKEYSRRDYIEDFKTIQQLKGV